jgi:ribonuclease D
MISHPELITTAAQISALAEKLGRESIIAYDTEFIRESTFFPVVEIIQIATATESWLIDARAFTGNRNEVGKGQPDEAIRPLLEVFENPRILKVAHAIQGDQECLYTTFGVVAKPSLDTAVAASLCGYGDGIGLGNLLKAVLDVSIKKGHARTNWSVRPLPAQLIEYAHSDVTHLVELAQRLMAELEKHGRRDWAIELTSKWESPALYESDPEGQTARLVKGGRLDRKGQAALAELMKWREARVRQLNLPRRWVADDNVLMDLAHVRPKDMEHLGAFRGLNKGELKHSGQAILDALKRASEVELPPSQKGPRPEIPTTAESQVLDLLKCYIGMLADRHRIAAKHLLVSAQLLPLLRAGVKSRDDLVTHGILTDSASGLVGDEIVAFLQGRRALSVDGRKVKIVEV